jgi:biotin operon repressor
MIHAVITGDIVNSTQLQPAEERLLLKSLKKIFEDHKHEFFRGDSFQAYIKDASAALQLALLCRTAAIGLHPDAEVVSDVRVSIGVGSVDSPVRLLATAKGEAFLLSGRGLDSMMKTEGRLVITTENKMGNLALALISDYINSIYKQMTAKQAEVIFELLCGLSQQEVADKLGRSKSTISQHVSAGRWDEIESVLNKYRNIVQLLSI